MKVAKGGQVWPSTTGEQPGAVKDGALRSQTITEKHLTVAKQQAKGRQTRAKRGQVDAKGLPREQKGGQGRRKRVPTPRLASLKTAQDKPKAVPTLAQKHATHRKRETLLENTFIGLEGNNPLWSNVLNS